MKTFYNVFNAIICCAKEARALITGNPGSLLVSPTYGAKFRSGNLLENGNKNRWNLPCGELLLSLMCTRSFGKNSLLHHSFIVLYFGAVQLSIVSQTEQCRRDWWMPHYDATANANTIHFPGLIYCDRTWLLFLGVQIRLLTRCKICFTLGLSNCFSLKSLSLCLKSRMNVPLSVDYKVIVWFKLWIF